MNQARGRLKTILHSRLWIHARNLLRLPHSCDCWKVTISEYLSELVNLNVFPLEDFTLRTSICEITQRIRQFKHQSAAPDCADCNINWIGVVFGGVRATEAYFDGLCLDCMDRSRVKDGDKNHWLQCGAVDKRWDSRCRIKHGEPTWYASWLGRNDHKQKLLDMRHAAEDVPGIRFDTEKVTVEPPSVDEAKVHSPAEEAKPDSLVEEPEVESLTEDAKEDASQESNADEAKKFYELQGSEIMD
ncbi:uncharacterized protein BDZ99DRAFT_463435 [Mytilinidion resinicola]|uniref:Uncharacterized protein n=1 Tax=Mytilinidion resinicola TaxID=574789 RepID=A0A6A6YM81_9PEZI|nr:uncharacterized protein BDZ99DRAFT_463435 [Mytilinidion resinicola]KAF2809659.1 hypothetical protein BDZ99DRAFT_463435 [Mytilinidion resinicola]